MGTEVEINIDELLQHAISARASDIHLKVGSAPILRVDGELRRLDEFETLRPTDTQAYAEGIFTPKAAEDFKEKGTADFAYGRQDIGRFRVSAFRQRGSISMILRRVVPGSRTFEELGLPEAVTKFTEANSGLILVTGPSGSGKTTTMASMLDWINTHRSMAILTVEDPIEVLHPDKKSVVAQREVGVDTSDMEQAIRGAMRHDTDVIMVSEINDVATARAAVDAAETGHLVLSSMRTTDPADTVNRLVSMFPDSERPVVRNQLASLTQGIISQLLIETTDSGRALICEVLASNERSREWIKKGSDPSELVDVIRESGFHGMQTFDQGLLDQVLQGNVALDAALPYARNNHEMRAKVLAAGIAV